MNLTHLSLFSGIGGLDIAAEMAGFETVGQCEWWPYARRVLEKHWPGLPRWRDIRTLTGEDFYAKTGLGTVDVISGGFPCQPFSLAGKRRGTEDDRYLWPEMLRVVQELRPTWVIGENVGGLVSMVKSVSPFRVESRSLNRLPDADYYEGVYTRQEDMLLVSLIEDLERIGYAVQAFVIPACAVGACHRRDRIALVAYNADCRERNKREKCKLESRKNAKPTGVCADVADTHDRQCQRQEREICPGGYAVGGGGQDVANAEVQRRNYGHDGQDERTTAGKVNASASASVCAGDVSDAHLPLPHRGIGDRDPAGQPRLADGGRRSTQPRLGRVADDIPAWMDGYWLTEPDIPRTVDRMEYAAGHPIGHRVDRLKGLGNAVYWRQFYPILAGIYHIETGGQRGENYSCVRQKKQAIHPHR